MSAPSPDSPPGSPRCLRPRGSTAPGRPRKTADERDEGNRRQLILTVRRGCFVRRASMPPARATLLLRQACAAAALLPFRKQERAALRRDGRGHAARRAQPGAGTERAGRYAPRARLAILVRHHCDILLGPAGDFVPVMLYEWRSLTPAQRAAIAQIKAVYEAPWMPVLQALYDAGALRTEPGLARLFILGP